MKFKINYILFLCLISSVHQQIKASSSLRRSATALTPALRRTNPSLQQTAQYSQWRYNTNPDGSEESSEFNDNNQLERKTIKYPDNTESYIFYSPNGTIKQETFKDKKNHSSSTVYYYNDGSIEQEVKRTEYPKTSTWYYPNGNISSKNFEHDNGTSEYTSFDPNGIRNWKEVTYPQGSSRKDEFKFYTGISSLFTPFPLKADIYTYDKNGNNVGATGTYDVNGLDEYGSTTDGKLEELD